MRDTISQNNFPGRIQWNVQNESTIEESTSRESLVEVVVRRFGLFSRPIVSARKPVGSLPEKFHASNPIQYIYIYIFAENMYSSSKF